VIRDRRPKNITTKIYLKRPGIGRFRMTEI
jgi:hypothetical protein